MTDPTIAAWSRASDLLFALRQLREENELLKTKREWVGLTDEDIQEIHYQIKAKGMGAYKTEDIYRAIEAKLREKNT